ncbi:MAG: hypothetical protein LQ343_003273 [Gyalolechia ehrenbergii]|nr:MAG: hypothetical protein LQ343_003273 [Gyalolechia ehrenbergii]
MGFTTRFVRIPRPQTFLYLMSLRTGTELITLSILFNKVSGFYGLLALLTGLHLSPLQLSMYIYSLIALIITVLLASHIRSQSPFHCLALACFYILDSVINAAYTAAFAITWFLVISQHHSDASGDKPPGAGGSTIDDTAGFTSPQYNVSRIDVAVAPDQGVSPGDQAVAVGQPGFSTTASGPSLGHGVLQPESMSSIFTICALWAVRAYFVLVVMSYARLVLRQHVAAISRSNTALHTGSKSAILAENPFEPHLPEGKGWKGKLGRLMIGLGKTFWLGNEGGDAEWMNTAQSFRRREEGTSPVPGVVERERRRRSGTGPPPPIPPLQAGQYLRVQDATEGR